MSGFSRWQRLCAAMLLAGTASSAANAQTRDSTVVIGTMTAPGGSLKMEVYTRAGERGAYLFTRDRHPVSTVLLQLSAEQLTQLRQLIDDTLHELQSTAARGPRPEERQEMATLASEVGRACRAGDSIDLACSAAVAKCRTDSLTMDRLRECLATAKPAAK